MEYSVLTTSITEPVTAEQMRDIMGYPTTDQDTEIAALITAAREWLEARTGLSLVSKSYKAYFLKEDAVNGWYLLPFSPVLSNPAITVEVCGTADTGFETKGLNQKWIKPSTSLGTLLIGATATTYYMEVTFQAGASNTLANRCLKRIVTSLFNQREDGVTPEINTGRLPFDTLRLIDMLDQNTGF